MANEWNQWIQVGFDMGFAQGQDQTRQIGHDAKHNVHSPVLWISTDELGVLRMVRMNFAASVSSALLLYVNQ
jgi:hypothetical protein